VAVASLDPLHLVEATDVDEVLEDRQAHGQHGDQALSAGDRLGVLAQLGQHCRGIGDAVRPVVFERGGLHRDPFSAG